MQGATVGGDAVDMIRYAVERRHNEDNKKMWMMVKV